MDLKNMSAFDRIKKDARKVSTDYRTCKCSMGVKKRNYKTNV